MRRHLTVNAESWPIAGSFTIARGAKTTADVVVANLTENGRTGRGECVPYARYGETAASVTAQIETLGGDIERGLTRAELQDRLGAGAARNALDCALWDLEAKLSGRPVWELAGLTPPAPVTTAYTISLARPQAMAKAARAARDWPLLKLKLGGGGGDDDAARLDAVRAARPDARLIVDANEGWTLQNLERNLAACARANIELIEQPLPAAGDHPLGSIPHAAPVCADESVHGLETLERVKQRYDAVNIKLDKTGGLTGAIALVEAATAADLKIMIGCMVATSLSMAPALLLAGRADFVDLDGAFLLARDRDGGLERRSAVISGIGSQLWGCAT